MATTCPTHGREMVYGGIGAVRCPEPTCPEHRRTECGAFIRRIRPYGRTVVCREPVAVETWAYGPNSERVYHGGRCRRHPDTARYEAPKGSCWAVRYEEVRP